MSDTPRHRHNCPRCVFLGDWQGSDLYHCPDHQRDADTIGHHERAPQLPGEHLVMRIDDLVMSMARSRWHFVCGPARNGLAFVWRRVLAMAADRGLVDKRDAVALMAGSVAQGAPSGAIEGRDDGRLG